MELKRFYKVWFSNGTETTAKLVLDTEKYPIGTPLTVISRLYPVSEAPKMRTFIQSTLYGTRLEAFHQHSRACDMMLSPDQQFYEYDSTGTPIRVRKQDYVLLPDGGIAWSGDLEVSR